MTTLPLGIGAYKRQQAGEPEIKLINRFVEKNPTNLREHIALLSRSATTLLTSFAPDVDGALIRGTYSFTGLFNSDLFVVSGKRLYRYGSDGTKTLISGEIKNAGHPSVTWVKGIGYERLFIADGTLLQYYDGGSPATGRLTLNIKARALLSQTDFPVENKTVTIGTTDGTTAAVYTWKNTSTTAFDVTIGATVEECLDNLAAAVNLADGEGTKYGTGTTVNYDCTGVVESSTTMRAQAKAAGTAGNSIAVSTNDTNGVWIWPTTTLQGGASGVKALALLTQLALPLDGNTVTIGTKDGTAAAVYRWVDTLSSAYDVLIAGDTVTSLGNLVAAVNAASGAGTKYGAGTAANNDVAATAETDETIQVQAKSTGTAGNSIAVATDDPKGSWAWEISELHYGKAAVTDNIANQVIQIGPTYYGFNDLVDSNDPDGTASHPFLVKPTSDPGLALANALNFIGTAGEDFSSSIGGQNTQVTALEDQSTPAMYIDLTSRDNTTGANDIETAILTGHTFEFSAPTLLGGGIQTLYGTEIPTGEPALSVTSLDDFVLVSISGTRKFFFVRPGETTIDALDFATKESNPDPIIDMATVGDVAILMGTASMETWYATGDNTAPLAPVKGRGVARGIIEGTAVEVGGTLIVVGDDKVVYNVGNGLKRVSDHGIEERIRRQIRREEGLSA